LHPGIPSSHTQIFVQLVEIGLEFGIGEPVDDATILHHVVAIRNRRSEVKILLDQQDGETLLGFVPASAGCFTKLEYLILNHRFR
jgi:hypothetical protein